MMYVNQIVKSYKLKKIIALAVLGCFIIAFAASCAIQSDSKPDAKLVDGYISRSYSSVDLENGDMVNQLGIFDGDIDKYEIFLTGEAHSVAINYGLQLEFLKYFNEKAGARYLLSEIGYSSGAYINRYLETGNEENLKIIFDNLMGTAAWNRENYEFYKKLREYNMSLPDNRKIKVIGIDIEHQAGSVLKYLFSILPAEAPPVEIEERVEKLRSMKGKPISEEDLKNIAMDIQRDIEENEESYRNYLGGDFFDFSIVVDNVINRYSAYEDDSKFNQIREESIYSNFTRVYDYYPKSKYYGQWGMEHVYQKTCDSYMGEQDRIAMYINNSESLKGKVLSIAYGYEDCYYANNQAGYKKDKVKSSFKDQKYLSKYTKTDITILKLNGDNSPFSSNIYFVDKPLGGVTTDYFQYFVLIKDSDGTAPYGEIN